MQEILIQILKAAYVGVGIVNVIAYWPTISDLWHKKPSANSISYLLWTGTTSIAFLYSLFVLPDLLFRIVSAVNFGSCALILALRLRLKSRQ